ncbi:MAG: exonuclease [Parcubacteria group bacterium]|nr:exonuclease [Parcubacteria group bacterium]
MAKRAKTPEVLVSVDGEFTGRIPGPHSMIALGAVAYTHAGDEISRFKVHLEELPGASREEVTMEWWSKFPDMWKALTTDAVSPKDGMLQFANWLDTLPGPPKLLGWPLPIDFTFLYWYYVAFVGDPPFGHDGIDIKTYAMAVMKAATFGEVSRTNVCKALGVPNTPHSHDPVDDAAAQAELFFRLKKFADARL